MVPAPPGSHYLDVAAIPWSPTEFPGVDMKVLWRETGGEAFTALFRLAPGARLPLHRHRGVEQTWVLEGSLADDAGVCTRGNFVWRDAGSVHTAYSPEGCVIIGILQKTNELIKEESPVAEPGG